MALFAAIQHTNDRSKHLEFLDQHLDYLRQAKAQNKLFLTGPFTDGTGGLILYIADTPEEAQKLAEGDPFIKNGVAELELRPFDNFIDKL